MNLLVFLSSKMYLGFIHKEKLLAFLLLLLMNERIDFVSAERLFQ
jgi:hypothetical protein